jgi:hypothetical protein
MCPRTPGPSDTEQVPDRQVALGAGISAHLSTGTGTDLLVAYYEVLVGV